ncbi:hypothetical protein PC121_g12277 [Phytophthora cactorum]|nr:hypothetical protein PC121_g12277 [Phytophthora cactorum]
MKFLRGTNQAAKLRQRTPLRPVTRQATRWSSTFAMVERYFKLKPFLDAVDDELAVYMPSPLEDKRLCGALDELKDFESSDGEGAVSWKLFGSPGPIFKFPIFERACVQVQNGETRYMTSDDIAALAPFASQGTSTFQSLTSSNSAKKLSFAEEELKKRRMQDQQQPSGYKLVHYNSPTSNVAERFFLPRLEWCCLLSDKRWRRLNWRIFFF